MSKRDTTQEALDRLRELEGDPPNDSGLSEVSKFLGHRVNHVVGRAAQVVEVWGAVELISDLEHAFYRLMNNPVKSDPMCAGKLAIVKCLQSLEYATPDLMLMGVRHIQMEPVWSKPGVEDTAPGLRGACGRALASMRYPEACFELGRLIMDSESEACLSAIDTLGWLGGTESELLLRTKVLHGVLEPDVAGACFHALMSVNPERSLSFVAEYLDASSEWMEGAALAIGESKLPEAFLYLKETWDCLEMEADRQVLLLPLVLHRSEEAFGMLLDIVSNSRCETAMRAIGAMGIFSGDENRAALVRKAVEHRSEPEIREVFRTEFGP